MQAGSLINLLSSQAVDSSASTGISTDLSIACQVPSCLHMRGSTAAAAHAGTTGQAQAAAMHRLLPCGPR